MTFDIEKYNEDIFYRVKKNDMLEFLGTGDCNLKKADIIIVLKELFNKQAEKRKEYLNRFALDVAVGPYEVIHILSCTKTELTRWTNEGRLPVIGEGEFKYGSYKLYDRWAVENDFPKELLDRWREEYQDIVKQKRIEGAVKSKVTLKENKMLRDKFNDEYELIKKEWNIISPKEAAVLKLAYWTVWISRWAKKNHVKALNARSDEKREEYTRRVNEYYQYKNMAVAKMARSSISTLSCYMPANPHKVRAYLCDEHFEEYQDSSGGYETVKEYVLHHPKKYLNCPRCEVEYERNYYVLYYLKVSAGEYIFSFHTPYNIGKKFLPDKSLLPMIESQIEQEGIFRFGRAIQKDEEITHPEKTVVKRFLAALHELG